MPAQGGMTYNADGRLIVTAAAITTFYMSGGWAIRSDGAAYVNAGLGGSPLPGGAFFLSGLAFSQNGKLYLTESPASDPADVFISGMRLRNDGVIRCVEAIPAATDPVVNGWKYKLSTGQLYIQVIA